MRGERAWGEGSACGVHEEGPTQGTRRAHVEHLLHGRDLGRVEAERLVERRRVLPSRKAGMRRAEEVRPGRREGVGRRQRKRRAWGWPDSRLWGGRARAERTVNMYFMLVTPEVSKLSG